MQGEEGTHGRVQSIGVCGRDWSCALGKMSSGHTPVLLARAGVRRKGALEPATKLNARETGKVRRQRPSNPHIRHRSGQTTGNVLRTPKHVRFAAYHCIGVGEMRLFMREFGGKPSYS